MLGRLDPAFLDRLWFPLGEQTKAVTRTEAEAAGLAAAGRAESQEACFLAGGDYRAFLERRGLNGDGPIVDEDGRELGRHGGVWRFTPGQRRGLGVASSAAPLYAVRTDAATSTLVVGPRESLATTSVSARGRLFVDVERVEAKLRYRSPGIGARVIADERGFQLQLDRPAFAVAAGQAAVLYDDDAIVGSGLITGGADA
jgi:tRNA-specific 2-thiouridylase